MTQLNRRLIIASAVAPVLGIVALTVVIVVTHDWGATWADKAGVGRGGIFFLLLFGTPIGYVMEAVIGIPAYHWLTRTGRLQLLWVLGTATLGGVIAFVLLFSLTFQTGRLLDVAAFALGGACGGAVAGGGWWVLAFADFTRWRAV